jgi:hypothetical protein
LSGRGTTPSPKQASAPDAPAIMALCALAEGRYRLSLNELTRLFALLDRREAGEAVDDDPLLDEYDWWVAQYTKALPPGDLRRFGAGLQKICERANSVVEPAWAQRGRKRQGRHPRLLIRCNNHRVIRPRRMWKRGFRLARGDPDPDPLKRPRPAGSGRSTAGRHCLGLSDAFRAHSENRRAAEFFPPRFFGAAFVRPDAGGAR